MITIKSPVTRVGNKSSILHILYALFPLKYSSFVDVFGGSGSVLLGNPNPPPFEVYNDLDINLVILFRCIKERPLALIRELSIGNLNAREEFERIKEFFRRGIFMNPFHAEQLTLADEMFDKAQAEELKPLINQLYGDYDVRRAAMYMKLLRYSYASGGKAYGCQPFDMRKVFNLITQASDRLQNAVIENQDFGTLIKHYDDEKALIYCDPPYFSTEGMYDVGFGWDDHVRLRDTLAGIDGKFLLSYNDCPEIRQLYEGYPMFDFTRTHSMAQRYHPGKQFKELLIANYDLYEREKAKPKQMSIFDSTGDLDDGSNSFDYERILKECILTCKVKK